MKSKRQTADGKSKISNTTHWWGGPNQGKIKKVKVKSRILKTCIQLAGGVGLKEIKNYKCKIKKVKTPRPLAGGVGRCAVGGLCWVGRVARGTRGGVWERHGLVRVIYARKNTEAHEKPRAAAAFLHTFLAVEKSMAPQA